MRLTGAVTEGSGAVNEDGYGFIGTPGDVRAAWIFDGVTGINTRSYLSARTDVQWLVQRAHQRLLRLADGDIGLDLLLRELVGGLIADWDAASHGLDLPPNYDPPAACLVVVKRYAGGWKALRLGDSCLLARGADGAPQIFAASPNNAFDHWLSREARRRRDEGQLDIKALLAEFRPQLQAGRARRNQRDGYSILECSTASLLMPEFLDLGAPAELLLCTDGYYRAVDHYGLCDDAGLMDESLKSVDAVLGQIRKAEAMDPDCERYLRFKPADDATAVMLTK